MKRLTFFCISIFIFGLLFATLSTAKIDYNTAAGIWRFEEKDGDTIKDSSKNGNNGKADGTKHVAGKVGSALSFDGKANKVTVPDSNSLDLQGAWTISAWIKVNKTEKNWGHILGKRDDTAPGEANYAFRVDATGIGWDAYFNRGGWKGIWTQGKVKPDEWFYMTATYDGKDIISIYENGVKIDDGKGLGMGAPASAGKADVIIGGWMNNITELLDGTLDEVILLGSMITTDDMKTLMNDGMDKAFGLTAVDKLGKVTTEWGSIKTSH